jgi:hypothetical protein
LPQILFPHSNGRQTENIYHTNLLKTALERQDVLCS